MSLQWSFVAGVLYVEIVCVVLLLLPFVSAQRWKKILYSRLFNTIANNSSVFFVAFIVVLLFLFVDALREVSKYQDPANSVPDMKNNPNAEMMVHMKLFRAQRNLYIAGFALFLWLVLRRLVTLVVKNASLEASYEAAMKQATSASDMAQSLLDGSSASREKAADADSDKELLHLRAELKSAKDNASRCQTDLEVMQQQARAVTEQYDRLMAEHELLQKQLSGDNKKDD